MTQEWEDLAAKIRDLQRQLAEVTRERDQMRHELECEKEENSRLGFQVACSHGPWGHNVDYDVCLKCGYREGNDEGI